MEVTRAGIDKTLSVMIRGLFGSLMVLMFFAFVSIEANKKPDVEIARILEEQKKLRIILATKSKGNENLPKIWPPKMNSVYPELELYDQAGKKFLLSSLSGRVIVLEYIDIASPTSQAQSGSATFGVYYGAKTQEIDKQAQPFSKVISKVTNGAFQLPNDNVYELKIIIYGADGAAGSRDDAELWAEHFKLNESANVIVAVPSKDMRSDESQSLIRGFQLLDRNMILRVDSSGIMPKHNLQMTLAPLIPKLIH
ncbi:MAG: hypothetical protein COA45_10090 [Zetaproteobacteria bacterium]|nr:MAG: hypothetical protein COA45_10090 [Zetaproteobacteria bacterium]